MRTCYAVAHLGRRDDADGRVQGVWKVRKGAEDSDALELVLSLRSGGGQTGPTVAQATIIQDG